MAETTTKEPVVNEKKAPASQSAEQEQLELTINDLTAIKQIIDVASSRGSFKPNEMTVIGSVYTKLEAFLNAVAQQQKGE
jgi:cell division protein FtsL